MSDEKIIHVSVKNAREDDIRHVRNAVRDTLPDYTVIVSDDSVELAELPKLDDYADELAKRVAEELNDNE